MLFIVSVLKASSCIIVVVIINTKWLHDDFSTYTAVVCQRDETVWKEFSKDKE